MAASKGHKKKVKGAKAAKAASSARKKARAGAADGPDGLAPRTRALRSSDPSTAKARNPRAFTVASRGRAKQQRARTAEKEQKRVHAPAVDAAADGAAADVDAPPFVVLVHGPPGAGKTTLIKALVKHYTRQSVADPRGPVTVVAGRARRLTLIECPPDAMGMLDAAKVADLVLLLIDAHYGFEMETFELLNMLQVSGFPKVMGVLTHLDGFRDAAKLKKAKKALKHRFWTEVYAGAKLFYLSGMRHGSYPRREILNLARFISIVKFRPLTWRSSHAYVLADRVEDITPGADVAANPAVDRTVAIYGWVRGAPLRGATPRVHVPGVGDFTAASLTPCPDPCPRPGADAGRRKRLGDRDRLIYAPMSDVGRLLFDKDAMYVDIPDHRVAFTDPTAEGAAALAASAASTDGVRMVKTLQSAPVPVDAGLAASTIRLFEGGDAVAGGAWGEAADAPPQPRARRAAPVGTGVAINAGGVLDSDASDDGDEDGDGGGDTQSESGSDGSGAPAWDGDDDDDDGAPPSSPDSEGLGGAARWKAALADNAARLYAARGVDLAAAVYGGGGGSGGGRADAADSDSDGELFTRRGAGPAGLARGAEGGAPAAPPTPPAADDAAAPPLDVSTLLRFGDADRVEALRNRFVTGDWDAAAARGEARPMSGAADEDDDDAPVFGDWEDVDAAGGGDGDAAVDAARAAIAAAEAEAAAEAKAAKKAAFDAAYDEGGGAAGVGEGGGGGGGAAPTPDDPPRRDDGPNFYDDAKAALAARAARTRAALDALPARERAALAGVAPGTYVKLTLARVPCELMAHWSPRRPLYAGELTPEDEGRTFLQLRFKRHRWAPCTLKARDPLVLSIGWRRTQSLPVYATEDANGRHRALKYTPDHAHCIAHAYAPSAPAGTGVLAVQAGAVRACAWRVAATGAVLGADPAPRVVKKLKLVGEPTTIHKRTAFVRGLFTSALEAAKFEGAAVRTAAGLRGIIKKAATDRAAKGSPGTVRISFEDKPLLSDVVFLRAWVVVDLPRTCVHVTDLLAPAAGAGRVRGKRDEEEGDAAAPTTPPPAGASAPPTAAFDPAPSFWGARAGWVFGTGARGTGYYRDDGGAGGRPTRGGDADAAAAAAAPATGAPTPTPPTDQGWVAVRTVAELRRAAGIGAPRAKDSLYREIDRPIKRVFNPLGVPKSLQAALPFKSKPREASARKTKSLDQKRGVVRAPGERATATLVSQLNAIRNAKAGKRREKEAVKRAAHAERVAADAVWRGELLKERKKARWVEQGRAERAADRKRQRRE